MTSRDPPLRSPRAASRPEFNSFGSSSPDLPSLTDLVSKFSKRPPTQSTANYAYLSSDSPAVPAVASRFWNATPGQSHSSKDVRERGYGREVTAARPMIASAATVELIEISPCVPVKEPEHPITRRLGVSNSPSRGQSSAVNSTTPPKTRPWAVFKSPGNNCGVVSTDEIRQIDDKGTKVPPRKHTGPQQRLKADSVSLPDPTAKPVQPVPSGHLGLELEQDGIEVLDAEDLRLARAPARRSDWTPPRDTAAAHLPSDSSDSRELISSSDHPFTFNAAAGGVFQNLRAEFAYPNVEPPLPTVPPENEARKVEVLKKRKAIQLVPTNAGVSAATELTPVEVKPSKRAPKKKPRTITDLATSAFASEASGQDGAASAKADSLLDYFEPEQGEQVVHSGHPASKLRKPDRSRKGKGSRRQRLLSPVSAMDQSARQDFLFGTSSQLAREQSPTFLRDLQAALKASTDFDDPFASPTLDHPKGAKEAASKLWTAGARGESGDLMVHEVIDLLESPSFPEDPMAAAIASMRDSPVKRKATAAPKRISVIELDSSELDIPEHEASASTPLAGSLRPGTSAVTRISSPDKAATSTTPTSLETRTPGDILLEDDASDNEPPPSNQEAKERLEQARSSLGAPAAPRPNFELFTDAQLATQIRGYGFKAVKKRTAMIALLEQCWASKKQVTGASSRVSSSASISTTTAAAAPRTKKKTSASSEAASAAAVPKKPRGRPRKNSETDTSAPAPTGTTTSMDPNESACTVGEPVKRPRERPKKTTARGTDVGAATAKIKTKPKPMPPPPAPVPPAPSTPPRRKKQPAAKAAPATSGIEIADSDGGLSIHMSSPESAFSSPEHLFSSPGGGGVGVDLSVVEEDTELSLTASPTTQQASLFAFITSAVRTAPPTSDPANPSWHEKMLMYDPVVLEDLTAWLNAGQLDRVGCDTEVSPFEVKAWCESKSVCCLWRVNLRGKERTRF